ncbi:MAG: FadR/GntR family transcriptional regulator [Chloroflexota bacterium]|nr:FadR/GntR family transcriptional regulator [Chloroflexota bacterium]
MAGAKRSEGLTNQVADNMQFRIISHEFSPGSFLPSERELQAEYQVSRTVIREAIRLLVARGLITTNSRQGNVVNTDNNASLSEAMRLAFYRSNVYVEDILSTRLILEPSIVELAAQHASATQIRDLLSLSDAFKNITVDPAQSNYVENRQRWLENDRRFHILLAEASQNPVLPILIEVTVGLLWHQSSLITLSLSIEHHQIVSRQHEAIALAVQERHPAQARSAMLAHLEYTGSYLPRLRERLLDLGVDVNP